MAKKEEVRITEDGRMLRSLRSVILDPRNRSHFAKVAALVRPKRRRKA